jgi:hypothetical protein
VAVPAVDEDRVGPPSLYFVNQSWISYTAKMMAAGPVGDVANELVSIAIEQGDVPLHFGPKPMIEQGAIGRLRPGKEHAKIKRVICSECPKDRGVVLYRVRADDR